MKQMKRLTAMAVMTLFVGGLAACGDSGSTAGVDTGNGKADAAETAGTDSAADSAEGEEVTNPNFLQIVEILKDGGLDPSEPAVGENDVKGSKENFYSVIDGEDMLPIQVYELEDGDENLKTAKETGMVTLTFEGMEGEVPADLVVGNYIVFFAEGHPARDEALKLIEENFKPE